ncbi:MAG: hypothetical protein K2M31_03400 [Muribaculaceae bacterium]|nr:hypothetical protein [Muribaculaceae bacterium]
MRRLALFMGIIMMALPGIAREMVTQSEDLTCDSVAADSVAVLAGAEREEMMKMSLPELWEQAQWKKPEALVELAERYRYGRGGVEKSMVSALAYYSESPLEVLDLLNEASAVCPKDEFYAYNDIARQLMMWDKLGQNHDAVKRNILTEIDSMPEPRPEWTHNIIDFFNTPSDQRKDKYKFFLLDPTDGDSWMICMIMFGEDDAIKELLKANSPQYLTILKQLSDKIPVLASLAGQILLSRYDEGGRTHFLNEAMEFYQKLDNAGLLSRLEMLTILNIAEDNGEAAIAPFSKDDIARFNALCPPEFREIYDDPTMPVEEVEEIE